MSAGRIPALANASSPERTHGDSVKSAHSLMVVWEMASPVPSTHTGALAQSPTRSSATRTMEPPPSDRMQQWSLVNGSAIMGADWTSSMVISSRWVASGLSEALYRVDTAISASCSTVVPYWYMWRMAAMA